MKNALFNLIQKIADPLRGTGIGGKFPPLNWLYQTASRLTLPQGDITANVNGYKLKMTVGKDRAMDGIHYRLMCRGEYEPMTTKVFRALVKPGMTVVDAGAHIGYFTLLASHLAGAEGTVIAFEPEPSNFANLEANVALNEAWNVECLQNALSNRTDTAPFYVSTTESGAHSLIAPRTPVKEITVNVTTLTEVCMYDAGQTGLIKVDVEGNEPRVLGGAQRLLDANEGIIWLTEFWYEGLGGLAIPYWNALNFWYDHFYLIDEFAKKVSRITELQPVIDYNTRHKFSVNLVCSNRELKELEGL